MRVEVAFDLDESSEKLEIPWESADPEARHFDLREDPRGIARIEAARQHSPLRSFLAAVNSEDSVFSTARCKTWLLQEDTSGTGSCQFASRVDVVFSLERLNLDRSRYEDLTQRLNELLTREAGAEALCSELHVHFCRFRATRQFGFCLRIVLRARGTTPQQAELRWGLGLARIQQALLFLSRTVRQQMEQGS